MSRMVKIYNKRLNKITCWWALAHQFLFPAAGAGHSGWGASWRGVKRKAPEDPVKNGACLRNVPAPNGSDKDEFDV